LDRSSGKVSLVLNHPMEYAQPNMKGHVTGFEHRPGAGCELLLALVTFAQATTRRGELPNVLLGLAVRARSNASP